MGEDLNKLIEDLGSSELGKQRKSARKLAQFGEEALAPLFELLEDCAPAVMEMVSKSIVTIGGETAVRRLLTLIEHEKINVRNAASQMLEKLGREHLVLIMILLEHEDDQVRKVGADILGIIGESQSVSALETALDDEHSNVRCSAAEALGKMRSTSSSKVILEKIKSESETWVVFHYFEALGMMGDSSLVEEMMSIPLDQMGVCQEALIDTVAEIGTVENFKSLLPKIRAENPSDAAHLIQVLLRIAERCGTPELLASTVEQFQLRSHLESLSHHETMMVRLNAIVLMEKLQWIGVTEAKVYFESPFPDVRLHALKTLIKLEPEDLRGTLIDCLAEADAHLRYEAVLGMSHFCKDGDIEDTLLHMVDREATLVQVGIVKTLVHFGGPKVKECLGQLSVHDNPQVRKEAEQGLACLSEVIT